MVPLPASVLLLTSDRKVACIFGWRPVACQPIIRSITGGRDVRLGSDLNSRASGVDMSRVGGYASRFAQIACAVGLVAAVGATPAAAGPRPHRFRISTTFSVSRLRVQMGNSGPVSSVAVDPADERQVLVASESGGLFTSYDG